jgi:uncharacterized protein
MSLKETLFQDMKEALKEKDSVRKDVIQIVRAGILQVEKDSKIDVNDDHVVEIISREIKKRNDVLPDYEKSGRTDSIEGINKQLAILKSYLPKQLSNEEILIIIKDTITEANATSLKEIGKVMQLITPKIKGLADTKTVSELIKKALQ